MCVLIMINLVRLRHWFFVGRFFQSLLAKCAPSLQFKENKIFRSIFRHTVFFVEKILSIGTMID